MDLYYKTYELQFRHLFGVSGNTRSKTPTIFVRLRQNGFVGYGEACLPAYLGETTGASLAFLNRAEPLLNTRGFDDEPEAILLQIDALAPGHNAAKAAIDLALNDLHAKKAGKTFRDWKGLKTVESMPTSLTIGIDNEEKIIQKIAESEAFEVLKIKAGTANDKALVELVRRHTAKPLYIDVNQGWTSKEQALDMCEWLADKNVLLLEQPLPKAMKSEMQWLTARSPIPTFADESVKRLADLEQLDGAFTGINIKLMKCTGLNEALNMIAYCKANKLKIFLGCMAESSCATSAMAQLIGYADFIDLDAPQLYVNDPFKGITYSEGKIHLNNQPGIGAEPLMDLFGDQ